MASRARSRALWLSTNCAARGPRCGPSSRRAGATSRRAREKKRTGGSISGCSLQAPVERRPQGAADVPPERLRLCLDADPAEGAGMRGGVVAKQADGDQVVRLLRFLAAGGGILLRGDVAAGAAGELRWDR